MLFVPALLFLSLIILAFNARSIGARFRDNASFLGDGTSRPRPTTSRFADLVSELYEPIKLPVTAESFVDQRGNRLDNGGRKYWKKPLGKDILIVDIDTRLPSGTNDVFNGTKMDWEAVQASGSGLLTVSHVNHFFYCKPCCPDPHSVLRGHVLCCLTPRREAQIHGYDYKFFHAQPIKDHYNTWIKPHALQAMLRDYKFVVFIDADAIIQHLEVPMEFLFNRWNVSPSTSIALPVDTQQVIDGRKISVDSKGKVVLNTGVVVLQNLPYTHEMMDAWKDCTTEKRYPGCGQWKEAWSHEQRAFSEYIRYDFNPQGNNIIVRRSIPISRFPFTRHTANHRTDTTTGDTLQRCKRVSGTRRPVRRHGRLQGRIHPPLHD